MTARRRRDGRLVIVAGRSRSGKTSLVAQETASARRLIVYDTKGDPRDYPGVKIWRDVLPFLGALRTGPHRARLVDVGAQWFPWFCAGALLWGMEHGACTVVLEELATVTSPGKAPPDWGRLVRTGLGFGISIYAVTQRPAESDKSCFGNASEFVTFHLARAGDRAYMAREMDLLQHRIDALKELHYLRRAPGGEVRSGAVR